MSGWVGGWASVRACVRACVCVCVRVSVCAKKVTDMHEVSMVHNMLIVLLFGQTHQAAALEPAQVSVVISQQISQQVV